MKKILAVLLAAVMSLSLVTGCSSGNGGTPSSAAPASSGNAPQASSDAGSSEPKKLTVWVEKIFSDDANAAMEEHLKQYASENNVDMSVEFIAATDFMTKLNAAIEAKQVPDVTTGAVTKVMSYYPNLPYMDVTDLVSEVSSDRKYFDSISTGTQIDGKNYFVPYTSSSCVMFVRKDLLEAKGITEIPSTWEEVFAAAEAVADPANGVYGLGIGCGPTDEDCENTMRTMLWNYGANILDKDGNFALNSDAAKQVISKYKELYDKEVIPPAATTWDPSGNNKTYLMGESAIVFNAPTLYNALKGDEQYAELLSNTAVANMPAGPDNHVEMGYATGWSIMEGSENVETAKELIRYMMDKEWYETYTSMIAPVLAPVFEDMKEVDTWKEGVSNAVISYAEESSGYYGYPAVPIKARAVAAKHYFTFPVAKMLNSVVTSGVSVDDAIAQMEKEINDLASTIG